ncbi:MAG: InlB B-repeat-containing protein [Clostridia bacterium]|nr:InlB B-repeat-containing protein [Clostridia bacterium]
MKMQKLLCLLLLVCAMGCLLAACTTTVATTTESTPPPIIHTLTFKDADGSIIGEEIAVEEGFSPSNIPQPPTVKNKVFTGWCIEGQDDTLYFASDIKSMAIIEDVTFVACYKDLTYTVYFKDSQGNLLGEQLKVVVNQSPAVVPEAPILPHKVFVGWSKVGTTEVLTEEQVKALVITGDTAFVARYADLTFTVTFKGDQGADIIGTPETVVSGQSISAIPAAPVLSEKTFLGWALEGTTECLTEEQIKALVIESDLTLVAQYKYITFTVTFKDAEGQILGEPEIVITGRSPLNVPTAPAVAGKMFTGWTIGGEGELLSAEQVKALSVTSDIVLTPNYGDITYTVTFKGEDGSVLGTPAQVVIYKTVSVVPTAPSVFEKAFIGWTKDGDGQLYTAEQIKAMPIEGDTVFTAHYAYVIYTVVFQDASGEVIGTPESVITGRQLTNVPDGPAVAYKIFTGWSREGDSTLLSTEQVKALAIEANMIFMANYKDVTYTVTFKDANGNTIGTPETVVVNQFVTSVPEAPTVADMLFTGWSKEGSSALISAEDILLQKVEGDVTYTANYKTQTFFVHFVDADGVALCDPIEVAIKQSLESVPVAPTFDLKEFLGWKMEGVEGYLTEEDIKALVITSDIYIIADYNIIQEDATWEGTPIRTQADLAALATAPAGLYTIIRDIELENWTSFALPSGIVLDGHDHNIYFLTTSLFTEVAGTVKNLTIVEPKISGGSQRLGALAGKLTDGAVISYINVVNADIASYYAGGIAAEAAGNVLVEYCTVSGTLKGATTSGNARVGGIIAYYIQPTSGEIAQLYIENCTNEANITITSNSAHAAGILASIGQGKLNNECHIIGCVNTGNVSVLGDSSESAGILAHANRCGLVEIFGCSNHGDISNAKASAGGIASFIGSGSSTGPITPSIIACENTGHITGKNSVGGIIGNLSGPGGNAVWQIHQCINHGIVEGQNNIGGIVGYASLGYKSINIYGSRNYGDITGLDKVGGILGGYDIQPGSVTLNGTANYGTITATSGAAGGAVGYAKIVTANHTLTMNGFMQVGTIVGNQAGSIVGAVFSETTTSCYGESSTKVTHTIITGFYKTSLKFTSCVLSGNVVGSEAAGTLVGLVYNKPETLPVTLKDMMSDVVVTMAGQVVDNPAAYHLQSYVVDADESLNGTENEGKVGYYKKNSATLTYVVAYAHGGELTPVFLELGEVVGGINASVDTAGSAANLLNKTALNTNIMPTWENGEEYPEMDTDYNVCVIYFRHEDGTFVAAQYIIEGRTITVPSDPKLTGFTFKGWKLAGTDEVITSKELKATTVSADALYIAVFE